MSGEMCALASTRSPRHDACGDLPDFFSSAKLEAECSPKHSWNAAVRAGTAPERVCESFRETIENRVTIDGDITFPGTFLPLEANHVHLTTNMLHKLNTHFLEKLTSFCNFSKNVTVFHWYILYVIIIEYLSVLKQLRRTFTNHTVLLRVKKAWYGEKKTISVFWLEENGFQGLQSDLDRYWNRN